MIFSVIFHEPKNLLVPQPSFIDKLVHLMPSIDPLTEKQVTKFNQRLVILFLIDISNRTLFNELKRLNAVLFIPFRVHL
jgi:hypothetical protein